MDLGQGGKASKAYGTPGELGGVTTFGAYSSEDGTYYPYGYTDIANGQSFARTGVQKPVDGTGDGGAGGKGGDPGEGHLVFIPAPEGSIGQWLDWEFVVTKQPGPGHPGVDGAKGFVMVTWDKEDA